MWMAAAYQWTHSPSQLAWSEGWRPHGTEYAFIKWTGCNSRNSFDRQQIVTAFHRPDILLTLTNNVKALRETQALPTTSRLAASSFLHLPENLWIKEHFNLCCKPPLPPPFLWQVRPDVICLNQFKSPSPFKRPFPCPIRSSFICSRRKPLG